MKFRYKGCVYNTETMSEQDKEHLKDVIELAECKEKDKIISANELKKSIEHAKKLPTTKKSGD